MAFLSSMNIIGSGLTAEQLRLDVVSENISNINTTRTEGGGAYRRKMVVFEAQDGRDSFRSIMASRSRASNAGYNTAGGVRVTEIAEDPSDLKLVYDPTHPDANGDGYVEMPNVTLVKEVTDAMAATQAYSAGVTALNSLKSVINQALEIGR
ncbi:flagellar basal body rod protein FlgC [Oscillibacter ruminantium]|uniref:flagellar basal body rod protein FlgC n=1 Tax=Oscillibacter ruminantium TaxID=1263547 RepID=UPI0002F13AE8|nr:flagellar basal body rod protein FlgC [Oscillibacter ruminantium]MDN0032053.1 flagellar basal body rod protein FlgC [Oscillibacter valericigenes]